MTKNIGGYAWKPRARGRAFQNRIRGPIGGWEHGPTLFSLQPRSGRAQWVGRFELDRAAHLRGGGGRAGGRASGMGLTPSPWVTGRKGGYEPTLRISISSKGQVLFRLFGTVGGPATTGSVNPTWGGSVTYLAVLRPKSAAEGGTTISGIRFRRGVWSFNTYKDFLAGHAWAAGGLWRMA